MGSSVWVWPQDTWRGPFDSFPQDQNLVVGILILNQKQDFGINYSPSQEWRGMSMKKKIVSDKDNSESSEKMSEEIVVL